MTNSKIPVTEDELHAYVDNELPAERRAAVLNCVLSHHGAEGGRGASGGRGFAIPEALALCRLNALDAGVKGALEQGL